MVAMNRRAALIHGFGWGAMAGLVLGALTYLASLLLALKPLTQELNEPLLSIMPGFVFGFLIDTLQHAGKVVEELGLIVATIIATIRPSSSTTLPACCRVSMRKPNTKPGMIESRGSLSSWVSGFRASSRLARYVSAPSTSPAIAPHPKPWISAARRFMATISHCFPAGWCATVPSREG